MDAMLKQLLAPFLAILFLFIAKRIARWVTPLIPDGRVKRSLTRPRSNRSEFFERIDARIFLFFRSLVRWARGK